MATREQNATRTSHNVALHRSMLGKTDKINLKKAPYVPKFPHQQELFYRKNLYKIVALIDEALTEQLIPQLPSLLAQVNSTRPDSINDAVRNDTYIIRLNGIIESMDKSVNDNQPNPDLLASTVGASVSQFNSEQFQQSARTSLGVNIFQSEPWLTDQLDLFSDQNVDLINDISDKAFADIKGIVMRGFSSGETLDSITEDLEKRVGVTRSRAKLIARDQVGKLNGQLTGLRQTQAGISKYQWVTAGDERVRPTHAEKEGRIYSWDNPPADTGNPGDDINCRCVAIPVFEDLVT